MNRLHELMDNENSKLRSIDGTYHCVSPKHLQLYVDEFVYRYNLRNAPVFPALIARACLPVAGVGENRV